MNTINNFKTIANNKLLIIEYCFRFCLHKKEFAL